MFLGRPSGHKFFQSHLLKHTLSGNVEESYEKFIAPDPDADFQISQTYC